MSTSSRPWTRPRSLWIDTGTPTDYPGLEGEHRADVVVVGAGITGLTTALLLQQAGRRVTVLEGDRVGAGTTGRTTAKVTSLHGAIYARLAQRHDRATATTYAQANEAALDQVETLVREHAIECGFRRAPAYTYTLEPDRVREIEDEVEAAKNAGLPATLVTETELPLPVRAAVRLDGQIALHAQRYCLGLARAFVDAGGTLLERSRAVDVSVGGETYVVHTAHGTVEAEHVVLATLLPFLDRGGFFAKATPARSYLIAARVRQPALEGMYINVESPTRSLRSALDGEYLLVGGEGHAVGHVRDTDQCYERLIDWARAHFDVESIDYRWSSQDFMPFDDLPFIGAMPRGRGIMVATGFRKWGMSLGTMGAMLLRDRVLGREQRWAKVFDAQRLNVRQSLPKAARAGLSVAKDFVGDRLTNLRARDAAKLRPGEGDIVTLDGRRVAAFCDDDGRLHAVSAVCTHLGCQVRWNTGERSWDCPCHGSRFDPDGRVLDGPAVIDLAPVGAGEDGGAGS